MEFHRADLQTCSEATGAVVAIDVIRAFTTAAFAFAAGAQEIFLVRSIQEAFDLRTALPEAMIMGEAQGYKVEGFDLWNSPAQVRGLDLSGRRIIQRTSAGTQGVVLSARAEPRLAASFCVASATARLLHRMIPDRVTFVETGLKPGPGRWGDEDTACSDYMTAILKGDTPNPAPYLERVLQSPWGQTFADPNHPEWPVEDLECALQVDIFDFAMQAQAVDGQVVLRTVPV